jgi:hypothetical protein
LSRAYSVLIEYQQGAVPQVYVLDPDLGALANGRKPPHVYRQSPPQLCLYLPSTGEWSPSKRFSATIVPWTFLWLWYFEEWLASSVWKVAACTLRRVWRNGSIGGGRRTCNGQ